MELANKIDETQVDLQAIRMSVDTHTKNLLETVTDTREHFHEKLGLMIQGKAQMTKTLIDATLRVLEAKTAEVEERTEHGRGTGTGARAAKLPNFDRTQSWAVFQCQFETAADHNCWTCQE
jgi:hypothetical protein